MFHARVYLSDYWKFSATCAVKDIKIGLLMIMVKSRLTDIFIFTHSTLTKSGCTWTVTVDEIVNTDSRSVDCFLHRILTTVDFVGHVTAVVVTITHISRRYTARVVTRELIG